MLVELIPYYGIQSYIYIIVFCMIDKSDEWQLIRYIMNFKRMQFGGVGIIGGFIGYSMFFACSCFNKYETISDMKKCQEYGPGSNINIYSDLLGFFLQVVLVWLSFFLIPFA